MRESGQQSRHGLSHKLIPHIQLHLFGQLEVKLGSPRDVVLNDLLQSKDPARDDFMQTASELEVLRGEAIVAHSHVTFLRVGVSRFLLEGEVLAHIENVSVSVLDEGSHFWDLSFGDGANGDVAV